MTKGEPMSSYLQILINYQKKNKQRYRQYSVLKACMAASAVVAVADGHACQRENQTVVSLTKTLDKLKLFDPGHGSEIYQKFIAKLSENPTAGLDAAMEAIDAVRKDEELAQFLVMMCHTISEADGVVKPEETNAIEHICGLLRINPGMVKAREIDLRAEY